MQRDMPQIPGMPNEQSTKTTHLWDYWSIVMKRLWVVLLTLFIAVCVAAFVTQRQQKMYRAQAMLELLPQKSISTEFVPTAVVDQLYLETQLQKLKMNSTLQLAVTAGGLVDRKDFEGMTEAEIVRKVSGNVNVSRNRTNYLVEVRVEGSEPAILDDVTNALMETFRDMQRSESKKRRESRKAELEEQIAQANTRIRLAEVDIRSRLETQNFTITTFDAEYTRIQNTRERFSELRDAEQAALIAQEPTYKEFAAVLDDPDKTVKSLRTHPLVVVDNDVVRYHQQMLAAQRSIVRLRDDEKKGPEHDDVRAISGLLRELEATLDDHITALARGFLVRFELRRENLVRYANEIDNATAELRRAATVKAMVDERSAEIARHKEDKGRAVISLEQLNQAALNEEETVKITSRADEPTKPFKPNKTLNMTFGVILGLLGGIGLAFFLDYLDDTIRGKEDLQKIADVPLLGIVPNIPARKTDTVKKDLYAHGQPKSTISEAYRGVRTALTLSSRGPVQKVLLLTSAGPREGKTTTAINLATVLAYAGARTLVVDGDLRKPRVHKSFGVPNTRGVTNLVVGHDDPLEYCIHSEVEGVDVLPSGPIPPNPSELLGRPRMREILTRLRTHYDHVILDTPPIGAVTDAVVLATMVDGVILVVHAGKTRRGIVSRGLEQLRYINATVVGVILNNLRLGRGRYYPGYYHYYYYYTSYYGSEDRRAKPAPKKAGKGGRKQDTGSKSGKPDA